MEDVRVSVSALHIYPVKALRGVKVSHAVAERRGFRDDRRWMLVDDTSTFVSQRKEPRLALVDVALAEDGTLTLSADRAGSCTVRPPPAGAPRRSVTVWDDTFSAVSPESGAPEGGVSGSDARRWLQDFLGAGYDLVFMDDVAKRPVSPKYRVTEDDEVSFADGFPFLVTTEASLADLAARIGAPLAMERFRPNVVLRGGAPWDEDRYDLVDLGEVRLALVKPCARCQVTTLDPRTAERGREPLATLATFRRTDKGVLFGENAIATSLGVVRVGSGGYARFRRGYPSGTEVV